MNDTALPPFVRTRADGITLAVRVQPRARADQLGGVHNGELKVKVVAPPVDAAANEAVIRLVAGALSVPRTAVEIIRGTTGRSKVLLVRGISAHAAAARLAPE